MSDLARGRGLRMRVAAMFAVGGLALSATLAVLTYVLADRYLTAQRERSASRQAYLYARIIRDDLQRGAADDAALASLEIPAGSGVVLHRGGTWYASDSEIRPDDLPDALRQAVRRGDPVGQRLELGDNPAFVVGMPVRAVRAEFFMAFPLTELASTLGTLRNILFAAAGTTTAAAALVGMWSGRRVLRPLAVVGAAAKSISGGDLSARLEVGTDPDLAQLAQSFNEMVAALEARITRDARFAADVSHELRSPLTTLTSALSVLQRRRSELSERSREALDLLADEIKRFDRLVQDLLELARTESGADEVRADPVLVVDVLRHAIGQVRANGVHVDVKGAAGEPWPTDKRRLDRVLTNLLENAATHGGGARRVGVSAHDGVLRIEVDDEGPGVAVRDRDKIFDRFSRGPASGRRGEVGGTGIGLALVAEHVHAMRGRVWTEDPPSGTGARFVVEIPRDEA